MTNRKKTFMKFGTLSLKDLSKVTSNSQGLWNQLARNGYINEEGVVLQKFLDQENAAQLWEGLTKENYVTQQGIIPSKLNALRQSEFWKPLVKGGYVGEDGTSQQRFPELHQSSDLGLDNNSKDKKDAIIKILNQTHSKAVIHEWIESMLVALILAMVIRTFIVQAFKIPSGSMIPTLLVGDRILVNKLRYGPKVPFSAYRIPGFSKPQRGDVVVFVYPEDHSKDFIKRLIAVEGETVEIKNGNIYVNDQRVDNVRLKNRYYYNCDCPYGTEGLKVTVPKGSYFVLGDNSSSSKDSRYWGFVPKELMIGRAELIYWPLGRIRLIQ